MKAEVKSIQGIVDLASAYYGSAVLFAAIDCDVFAQVEAGTVDVTSRGMRLLLDACVAEGLLDKRDGKYFNTPSGKLALVPGGKADLTKAIRYNRDVYPAWGRLAEFVKTGRPVERPSVVPMLNFEDGEKRVLDLAGGPGAYAILMAQANPSLTVVTVDLPAISAEASGYVEKAGLSGRITCRAGDYHTDEYEESAYDVVTIFGALHQESPEQIVDILKRANRALRKGGRLLVLDMMTDSTHTSPVFSALFAVNMALTTDNGWVFSDEELKGWLKEAGLKPGATQMIPPPMPHWLVTAVK